MNAEMPDIGLDALWGEEEAWRTRSWSSRLRPLIAGMLAAAIFGIDTFTSLAGAVAVLYCLVMLIASEDRPRATILRSAGACLILAAGSFAFNHGLSLDAAPDFRFVFSLAAILTTASLLLQNAKSRRLQRAQARLLDVTTDAVILRSWAGAVLLWSKGAETLYRWAAGEMIDARHHELLRSSFETDETHARATLLRDGYWTGVIEQQRRDGTAVVVSSRWQLMRTQQGVPWGVLETNTDISARRSAEAKLRQSERRYRSIFETLAVGILEYDLSSVKADMDAIAAAGHIEVESYLQAHPTVIAGLREQVRVLDANEAAVKLLGEADRDGFLYRQAGFLPVSDRDFVRCLVALQGLGEIFESPARATDTHGDQLSLVFAMKLPADGEGFDRVQASISDFTHVERMSDEIARMRADLDQAMRSAAIAEVSATIAHEVNQPLAAIRTNASAARRWLARNPIGVPEVSEALTGVIDAVDRAGLVVKRVRRLFDQGTSEFAPVTVDEMIRDTVRLIGREVSETETRLDLHLGAGDARVLGSRILLQQCIVSLSFNALQAMRSVPTIDRALTIMSELHNGSIIVTISDSGPGFPREIIERTLDTFFHSQQGGLGLGLAICRSTILSIGGNVEFSNDPRTGGAVAALTLPMDLGSDGDPF